MSSADLQQPAMTVPHLDQVAFTDARGYVHARLGFAIVMFFPRGAEAATRQALRGILRDYHDLLGDRLTHFQRVDADRLSRIEGASYLDYYEEQARTWPSTEPMDATVYGYPDGNEVDEPSAVSLSFSAWPAEPLRPLGASSLRAYFPASFVFDRGYDLLLSCAKRWAEALSPWHGTAGFSVLFDYGTEGLGGASQLAFPATKRLPGLDYTDAARFTREIAQTDGGKIKSINWLTIISDELAGRVGGADALSEKLGPSCPIHRYPGGIVIQAGDQPQLGDVNRGLVLVDYRRVSQALKPIRFEDYKRGLFVLGEPFDQLDETLKWVRRLD